MPVRFKGVSEYSSSFKWAPSFKSLDFTPTPQQIITEAGLRSDQMSLLMEPSFTRKRQVPHRLPEAQSCLMWWEDEDIAADQPAPPDKNIIDDVTGQNKLVGKKRSSPLRSARKKQKNCATEDKYKSSVLSKLDKRDDTDKTVPDKLSLTKKCSAEPKEKVNNTVHDSVMQTDSVMIGTRLKRNTPVKHSEKPDLPDKHPKKSKEKSPQETQGRSVPLKYRPKHSRFYSAHQTEYQQMFHKPKKFIPSSPLISALDVVHASSPAIPPHKSPRMLLKSEYEANFHTQSPLSKSLPSFSSPASPSLKQKVKNLPTSPLLVHRSGKNVESEYAHQFPSRDFPVETQEQCLKDAKLNKHNRDACSFDRSHSVQLHSPKNKCWDILSQSSKQSAFTESEKRSADDVESVVTAGKETLNNVNLQTTSFASTNIGTKPISRKLAWSEVSNASNDCGNVDDINSDAHEDVTDAGETASETCSAESGSVATTLISNNAENTFEGRLPTPQLKQLGGALRTHHDLTTPCVGEALLSSPPQSQKSKVAASASLPVQTLSAQKNTSTLPKPKIAPPSEFQEAKQVWQKSSTITCTKPTKSATLPKRMEYSPRVPIRGSLRNQEFQHYGRNTRPTTAFDQVSIASSRSTASAQQLLERSLQRKDFWATK